MQISDETFPESLLAYYQYCADCGFRLPLILLGSADWSRAQAQALLTQLEVNDSVWFGKNAPAGALTLPVTRINQQLGRDLEAVVYDFYSYQDVNALAALAGSLVGGGCILFMGSAQIFQASPFMKRLWHRIQQSQCFYIWAENPSENESIFLAGNQALGVSKLVRQKAPGSRPKKPFQHVLEQQQVVAQLKTFICKRASGVVLLEADRGRGKSAAVGMALDQTLPTGTRVLLTAPRRQTVDSISQFIQGDQSDVQFVAPDQFLEQCPQADLLVVDEAAALAPRLLKTMLQTYAKLILVTTVNGYEGTGKGFQISLKKQLVKLPLQTLTLSHPIRWRLGDPFEQWLNQLLLFNAELPKHLKANESTSKVELESLRMGCFQYSDTPQSEIELQEIFALLSTAHYRTRPSDLQMLLDAEDITTFTVHSGQSLVAVATVAHEGPLPRSLRQAILQGKRRPKGHRLPQTMAVHGAQGDALGLHCWRIVRIAVHSDWQSQGIGSRLLSYILEQARAATVDAVGTLFSANEAVLNFWLRQPFKILRMGYQREVTTGDYSALLAMGLNLHAESVVKPMAANFSQDFPLNLTDIHQSLEPNLVCTILDSINRCVPLVAMDQARVALFLAGQTPYENVSAPLWRLLLNRWEQLNWNSLEPSQRQLLVLKVLQKHSWAQCCQQLNISGQKQARSTLLVAFVKLAHNLHMDFHSNDVSHSSNPQT